MGASDDVYNTWYVSFLFPFLFYVFLSVFKEGDPFLGLITKGSVR